MPNFRLKGVYWLGVDSPIQVYGGFNVGTFQSRNERDFYGRSETKRYICTNKKARSGLGKNQADASIAAKALNAIVLTNERVNKHGPLRLAAELGGKVVYLEADVTNKGLTLRACLEQLCRISLVVA